MSLEKLTNLCASILLKEVRRDRHVTMISEECCINRKYLNQKGFRMLRFHQLIRLLSATSSWTSREQFKALGAQLFETIWEMYD